jgi:mannose-6-phosphate isomerase
MEIVEKPWGKEYWIARTNQYALKIIEFNPGTRSSLQYHTKKHEHIYLDKGILQIERENDAGVMETITLKPGDIIENKPGRKHRVSALEYCRLFEVSTPELEDVVRLEDDYKR